MDLWHCSMETVGPLSHLVLEGPPKDAQSPGAAKSGIRMASRTLDGRTPFRALE